MGEGTAAERLKNMNTRFASLAKVAPQAMGAFRDLMLEASKSGTPTRQTERADSGSDRGASGLWGLYSISCIKREISRRDTR